MGAVCCTCSEEQKYRFKGFVVSVYPDDTHGGPDEDALGKLNDYVASNPERIPRVCRKISKIMAVHLAAGKVDRVMVSVKMLRSLIEKAKSVGGFVPHSIEMCARLLATADQPRYRIGAADVLCVLCDRLAADPQSEPSRRLIADSKSRLLPPLIAMCCTKDGAAAAGGSTSAAALSARYAGLVAIGQMSRCLGTALAGNAAELFFPAVVVLLQVLRGRGGKMVGDGAASIEVLLFGSGSSAGQGLTSPTTATATTATTTVFIPRRAELSPTEADPDLAYLRACVFTVGATAACTTAANIEPLTYRLIAFLGQSGGWTVSAAPAVIFRALVTAMLERPQGLGFTVFQLLCRAGANNSDPLVRIGVLRALEACMTVLPMSGGRPQLILGYLQSAMLAAPVDTADPNTKPTLDAIVSVTASLLRSIYTQRNAPQLQSVLAMLARLLSDCSTGAVEPQGKNEIEDEEEDSEQQTDVRIIDESLIAARRAAHHHNSNSSGNSSSRTYLALRCMAAAAPYVRTTPLIDRQNGALDVCAIITPFLSSADDAHRTWAARILRGIIAGMPTTATGPAASAAMEAVSSNGNGGGGTAPLAVLSTDEHDVAFAEAWVAATLADAATVTPRCVVEVSCVMTAIMAGYGVNALPFVLTTLWTLQTRCGGGGTGDNKANNAKDMVTSTAPSSPLSRAWLQAVLAVLASCGRTYNLPKVTDYAAEVLRRRAVQRPSELAACLLPSLTEGPRSAHRLTASGLAVSDAKGSAKGTPLSDSPSLAPVTKLPSFSFVANLIVDADRPDIAAVFGAAGSVNDLKAAIDRVCFSAGSAASVPMEHTAMLSSSDLSAAKPSELRSGREFVLGATPRQLAALGSLQVSLVDRPAVSAMSGGGTGGAAAVAGGGGALTATSNAGRIEEMLALLRATATVGPRSSSDSDRLPEVSQERDGAAGPPLFVLPAGVQDSIAARGWSLDRRLQPRKPSPHAGGGAGGGDDDFSEAGTTASASVATEGRSGASSAAPATPPPQEAVKAPRSNGSAKASGQINVADVAPQQSQFDMLQSSQYVDLE